jgi:hypothetical protein
MSFFFLHFFFHFPCLCFLFVYLAIGSFIVSLPLDEMILMIHRQKKMGIDFLACVKIVDVHNILDFFNVKRF